MPLTRWRTPLLAAVCAVAVATIYAAQPVLEQIGRDLGAPEASLGWIVAAGQLGYLVGLIALVPLGDMLDRRKLIAGQLLLAAGGTLLAAVASTLWLLIVGLALTGLFAVIVQTTVAFASDLSTAADRGRTLGIVTSGVTLGILGVRVVSGALAAQWGWRSTYVSLTLLLVILSAAVYKTLPAERHTRHRTYGAVLASFAASFRKPLFISRGLIAFFVFACFGTLWSGLALPLAANPWNLSTSQIGLFGVAGLAGALGAARAGRWADAGRTNIVTGLALSASALSWAASAQATWSLWLVAVGVFVLDFTVQAVHVSNQSVLTAAFANNTSGTIGGYMVFYSLGSILGAITTTAIYSAAGWAGCALLGTGFAFCGLVIWAMGQHMAASGPGSPR